MRKRCDVYVKTVHVQTYPLGMSKRCDLCIKTIQIIVVIHKNVHVQNSTTLGVSLVGRYRPS